MPGGVFALFFILYSAYRVLRQRTGTTWLHMLLAFGAIAFFATRVDGQITMMLIVGAALTLAGVVLLAIEQRRAKSDLNQSQGILTIGVSILLIVSALAGPTLSTALTQLTQEAVATAQEPAESTSAPVLPTGTNVTAQNVAMLVTNTPAPTATAEPAQVTLVNPLPTRYIYTTPVPTTTVVHTALCQGVVQNNLNMRANPSAESELLLTIPHSTELPVYGRNVDTSWLYVGYDSRLGWVSAAYVIQNADCGNLPIQES